MKELLIALIFSVGFNILMFIPAFIYKTDKLTDISYALTFLAVVAFSFLRSEQSVAHIVLLVMVSLWAVRLGGFLYRRILRMKVDHRFDDKRDSFFKFLGFWLIQGITVPIVMTASTLFFTVNDADITVISLVGLAIFTAGLMIEAAADNQKFKFSGDPSNKNKWIESGVWKYSRHPNYLGEIMVWLGVYIYAVSSIEGVGKIIALASPVYITCLLLFVSGIPLLEKSADKKWGSDKKYQEYKNKTPVLVPFTK